MDLRFSPIRSIPNPNREAAGGAGGWVLEERQRMAFLELVLMAMYADRHLATAEEVQVLLEAEGLGFESAGERDRAIDAATNRVRVVGSTPERVREHARRLAKRFAAGDRDRLVGALRRIQQSDRAEAPEEAALVRAVEEAFGPRT